MYVIFRMLNDIYEEIDKLISFFFLISFWKIINI